MATPSNRSIRVAPALFRTLGKLLGDRVPLIMVTVIESRGSAPGKAGGKMIVTLSATYGTVGGGRVELAAIEHARGLMGDWGPPETQTYDVIRDLGMTCGGTMTLLYERHEPAPRLVIFGAGHVSQSLCAMSVIAGFDVWVCDSREDLLSEERFSGASQRILGSVQGGLKSAGIDGKTFVVSVAPQHSLDVEVALGILDMDPRPRYFGVIGSRRKGIEFRKELQERGVSTADAEGIRIPVGLNIGATDPGEIAVSILAQLVAELRGSEKHASW